MRPSHISTFLVTRYPSRNINEYTICSLVELQTGYQIDKWKRLINCLRPPAFESDFHFAGGHEMGSPSYTFVSITLSPPPRRSHLIYWRLELLLGLQWRGSCRGCLMTWTRCSTNSSTRRMLLQVSSSSGSSVSHFSRSPPPSAFPRRHNKSIQLSEQQATKAKEECLVFHGFYGSWRGHVTVEPCWSWTAVVIVFGMQEWTRTGIIITASILFLTFECAEWILGQVR